MRLPNIYRLNFFSRPRRRFHIKDDDYQIGLDRWMTLKDCPSAFGFDADGVNFYIDLTQARLNAWVPMQPSSTLTAYEQSAFFQAMADELNASPFSRATIVFALQPNDKTVDNPYSVVEKAISLGYIKDLATCFQGFQQQCAHKGKDLRIVIRYAAEMNTKDKQYVWNRNSSLPPDQQEAIFKKTFRMVREAFHDVSPAFLMAFSPAIRSDITIQTIDNYFPGKQYIDRVSCSWYCGDLDSLQVATSKFTDYLSRMRNLLTDGNSSALISCAIDELGGCDSKTRIWKPGDPELTDLDTGQVFSPGQAIELGKNHQNVLPLMLTSIGHQAPSFQFDYVTLFLAGKWDTRQKVTNMVNITPRSFPPTVVPVEP
ncbi:hypothetical protein IAD21_02757 [Abditibacteriota bacterium]|nr:hypothetical protein IAD21_02757 [Abditibacteriota bacterium]